MANSDQEQEPAAQPQHSGIWAPPPPPPAASQPAYQTPPPPPPPQQAPVPQPTFQAPPPAAPQPVYQAPPPAPAVPQPPYQVPPPPPPLQQEPAYEQAPAAQSAPAPQQVPPPVAFEVPPPPPPPPAQQSAPEPTQASFDVPPPPEPPADADPVATEAPPIDDEAFEETVVVSRGRQSTGWKLIDIDGTPFPLHSSNLLGRRPAQEQAPEGAQIIALSDPERVLSRTHALIEVDEDTVWVTDLDSTNGTEIVWTESGPRECSPGTRVPLAVGEKLSFGGREIEFEPPEGTGADAADDDEEHG